MLHFELVARIGNPDFCITGAVTNGDSGFFISEQFDGKCKDGTNPRPISNDSSRSSQLPVHPQVSHLSTSDQGSETYKSCNPQNIVDSTTVGKDPLPLKLKRPVAIETPLALPNPNEDVIDGRRFVEGNQFIHSKPSRELALDMEDLDIPWSDLVLKERIGSGISPSSFINYTFFVKKSSNFFNDETDILLERK